MAWIWSFLVFVLFTLLSPHLTNMLIVVIHAEIYTKNLFFHDRTLTELSFQSASNLIDVRRLSINTPKITQLDR